MRRLLERVLLWLWAPKDAKVVDLKARRKSAEEARINRLMWKAYEADRRRRGDSAS